MTTKLTRRDWRNADLQYGGDGTLPAALGVKAPVVRTLQPRLYPTEWQEQCAVIAWWGRQCHAWGYDARHLFAIPNGSYLAGDREQAMIRMARLKSAGLRPGAPDLMLAIPRDENAGLFLEMKAIDGRVSQEQDDYHALLRRCYRVVVCKGAAAAIAVIGEYLGHG